MKKVPVFDTVGRRLAPCYPARARELLQRGKATPFRAPNGDFCLKLTRTIEVSDDERKRTA